MKLNRENLSSALALYAVTDRSWLNGASLAARVEEAILGGVTCVQIREKDRPWRAFWTDCLEIKSICARHGVPFIVNDDTPLAVRCDADGVHVGQSDLCVREARARVGADKLVGVSVHTIEQALAAEKDGADYLGVGSMFPTSTKADAHAVSLNALREICAAVRIPVVAIGGITQENLPCLSGSGVVGVALVSAIFAQSDITDVCRRLRAEVETLF